eukprot:UN08141
MGMNKLINFIDNRLEYIFGHFDIESQGYLDLHHCKMVLRATGQSNPSDELISEIFNPPTYTSQFVDIWKNIIRP